MSILEVKNVSIRYMTGDFKDIGLKEYVMRKLKGDYRVQKFWADKDITFSLKKGDMLGIFGVNGADCLWERPNFVRAVPAVLG